MSGRASLISRPMRLMMPMCSSLLSSVYFSSRPTAPTRPAFMLGGITNEPGPWAWPPERYVSREALLRTTMRRCVELSCAAMGTCCVATSCGSWGGGSDCVPGGADGAWLVLLVCASFWRGGIIVAVASEACGGILSRSGDEASSGTGTAGRWCRGETC